MKERGASHLPGAHKHAGHVNRGGGVMVPVMRTVFIAI